MAVQLRRILPGLKRSAGGETSVSDGRGAGHDPRGPAQPTAVAADGPNRSYAAFISYRHVEPDRKWAKWLHAQLERYRVPKRLARERGLPRRIGTAFRDEEELAASPDLSETIEDALQRSDHLIVVCSPRTPGSEWVNAEVERFRALGRGDRVLALLVEGEPDEAFPRSLREIGPDATGDRDGDRAGAEELEPLAADVRPVPGESARHRRRMAKLRLLATILGCRFDELRQREQERRVRRLGYLTAALLVVALVIAGLALYAEFNRRIAVEQREIALARLLTAQARLTAGQRGGLERGLLLSAEAVRRLESVGARSAEVDRVLREELALFPRRTERYGLRHANAVAFGPDGRHLTAASTHGTRLIEIPSDREVQALEYAVRRAALSPDGKYLATVDGTGTGGTATVREVASRRRVAELDHEGSASTVAVSPDGRFLAVILDRDAAGSSNVAVVWDVPGGQQVARIPHTSALSFSPDGRYLATAGLPGGVWELARGDEGAGFEEIAPLTQRLATAVAISPDGTHVVWATALGEVRLWEVANRWEVGRREPGHVVAVAASPEGRYVAYAVATSGSYADAVRVWEVGSGRTARIDYGDEVKALAFSPDGRRLAVGGGYRGVDVWEITGGGDVARVEQDHTVLDLALSHDGKHLTTVGGPGGGWRAGDRIAVRAWEVPGGEEIPVPKQERAAEAFALSPDGGYIALAHDGGNVAVREVVNDREVARFPHASTAEALALSADGRYVAVAGAGQVQVWDVVREKEAASFGYDGEARAIALGSNGWYLVTLTPRVIHEGTRGEEREMIARFWDIKDKQEVWSTVLGQPIGPGQAIEDFAFSPDARYLAVLAGSTGERASRVTVKEVPGFQDTAGMIHEGRLAAFSPDGRYLATVGRDSSVHVWEADGLGEVARIEQGQGVGAVAFSRDGRYLAAVDRDNAVRVWPLGQQDLVEQACSRLSRNLTCPEWCQYIGDGEPYCKTCRDLPGPDGGQAGVGTAGTRCRCAGAGRADFPEP